MVVFITAINLIFGKKEEKMMAYSATRHYLCACAATFISAAVGLITKMIAPLPREMLVLQHFPKGGYSFAENVVYS